MKRRVLKRIWVFMFCFVLFYSSVSVNAQEDIKHSSDNYQVVIQNASKVFIGNDTPVEWKVGDKYFLTYTVDAVEQAEEQPQEETKEEKEIDARTALFG